MVFCNHKKTKTYGLQEVTILILIDGFLQYDFIKGINTVQEVTILILIDGFLQYNLKQCILIVLTCHNPYFNRWFSAIEMGGSV